MSRPRPVGSDDRPIGVFDSGVGGLTVLRALEQALPRERFVYLGDTARVPYGTRSAETVQRYSLEAMRFLERHAVKLVVVACNSASSVALETVVDATAVPVLGVIRPGARRAVEVSAGGRIGVIGTRATIGSGAYTAAIRALRPDAEVRSQPCPLFVPLAEEGWIEGDVAHAVATRYLAPLAEAGIDTLVLGCTHYPLLLHTIADVMGLGVALVDAADAVALEARELLADAGALASPGGGDSGAGEDVKRHRYYVTDSPGPFLIIAERFLGRAVPRVEQVALDAP